jgi:LPPG:FO 2-phospho-L-lactate transferase
MNPPVYLALSGGVGGAKLVLGLARVLPPEALVVAVNVGDDFDHLGLTICPDLDTVLYTLSGRAHPEQGWGRADESWGVRDELRNLGVDTWFALGDRDIALHLLRRELLQRGASLSEVSAALSRRLGIAVTVLPVSDDPLRTLLDTDRGRLEFQEYLVRLRSEPVVRSIEFAGAAKAALAPGDRAALESRDLAGVIVCPSNPYLSIDPMLAVPGLRERLRSVDAPVLAVSPIVAGQALKGPAAKIMRELGVQPTATAIADLYADFVDIVVVDCADAERVRGKAGFAVAPTVMKTLDDKAALARTCIGLIEKVRS